MTAGVPGLGLSGLFLLASVIAMPMLRRRPGEVRPTRRRGLAVMAVAIAATTWAAGSVVSLAAGIGTGEARTAGLGGTVAGVPAILVSLAIVTLVVVMTEFLALVLRSRPTPTPPPVVRRLGPTPREPGAPASGFPETAG